MLKMVAHILRVICLPIGLIAMVAGSCCNTSPLSLTLDDLYYEDFYAWGVNSHILVAEVMIENDEETVVHIDKSYLLDDRGGIYVYVVSESGTMWVFEVTDTLEATALLPGGSIIVLSYL